MATSETVLTVIAIRLAALVVAGLVVRTAETDHRHQEIACVPRHAVADVMVDLQAAPTSKPEADDMMRDMRLHD